VPDADGLRPCGSGVVSSCPRIWRLAVPILVRADSIFRLMSCHVAAQVASTL
jgi:hypothetical protein